MDWQHNCGFLRAPDDWFYAKNAVITGDVRIGAGSSVWFYTVLRGDDAPIRIGKRVNLQDLTMVHPDPGIPLVIEDDVTIGHRAILHCQRIGRGSLIGMGAILMKNVVVGPGSLIAGGAVVSPGTVLPPQSLVRGVPGKILRSTTSAELEDTLRSVAKYEETAREYFRQTPT